MRILSFDCATKTLGICLFSYNTNWEKDLNNAIEEKSWHKICDVINNSLIVEYCECIDVAEIKDLDVVKARNLKTALEQVPVYDDMIVLIEFQMGSNFKSRLIFHYLTYHYAHYELFIIPAMQKNTFEFTDMKLQDFTAKYASPYTANKKHSTQNFLYVVTLFELKGISLKGKLDDKADAFMQGLAFVRDRKKYLANPLIKGIVHKASKD